MLIFDNYLLLSQNLTIKLPLIYIKIFIQKIKIITIISKEKNPRLRTSATKRC